MNMEGLFTEIFIVLIVGMIIILVMDFKFKYFIPETYNNILLIAMYLVFFVVRWAYSGFSFEAYDSFSMLIVTVAFIIINVVFIKAKFYCFKGIDKKFVKKNRNEIAKIIQEYKIHNLDRASEISLGNNKIIFEKVDASQIEECLSLIENYLDENRDEYTVSDYLAYYTISMAVPLAILATILFMVFKLIGYEL